MPCIGRAISASISRRRKIDLNRIVHPRTEVPPLLNVPLAEIIDFLVETGQRIRDPNNPFVQDCIDRMCATHILPRGVLENQVKGAAAYLDKRLLNAVVEQNFADPKALDEWVPHQDYTGRRSFVRAFAPRLDPRPAGQFAGRCGEVHRAGRDGEGDQPLQDVLERSFHHGRHPADHGGHRSQPRHREVDVGGLLARRRRFGGAGALSPAVFRQDRRLGRRRCDQQRDQVPGSRLSAGFVRPQDLDFHGRQGGVRFRRDARSRGGPRQRRRHGAQPGSLRRQPIHLSSRAATTTADRFCERLHERIVERAAASGDARPLDMDLREQIEMMMMMDDDYRVWGKTDGRGCVIRSDEPVEFHPDQQDRQRRLCAVAR